MAVSVALVTAAHFLQTVTQPLLILLGACLLAIAGSYPTAIASGLRRFALACDRHRTLVVCVALSCAAVIGVPVLLSRRDHRVGSCQHPDELPILTSAYSLESTREIARAYERWTADNNTKHPQCPTVHPFVYTGTSATITSAITNGWRETESLRPQLDIGPRPALWLADSTAELRSISALAKLERLPTQIVEDRIGSVGSSAMVLALPAGSSIPTDRELSWPDAITAAIRASGGRLLAPDPGSSAAGQLAAAGLLRDANSALVSSTRAHDLIQTLAATGAVAGEGNEATLCHFRRSSKRQGELPALVTSEQAWKRYLAGNPLGDGCTSQTRPVPAGIVIHPSPELTLDHPVVEFRWTGAKERRNVAGFRDWLAKPDGLSARTSSGLGRPRPDCTELQDNPCVPNQTDLDGVQHLYEQVRQPGLVLLALDASGSMAASVGQATRFTIAANGVQQALGRMGPQDQVGLWILPGPKQGGSTYTQLVPVGQGSAEQRAAIGTALGAVRPSGGTPLYDTITSGMTAVSGTPGGSHDRALVMLTDGNDTDSRTSLAAVTAKAADLARPGAGVRLFIIATGEASCDGPNGLRGLTDAGNGRCYDTSFAQVTGVIDDLFERLWKGQ